MIITDFLQKLDKVKSTGSGRWECVCPAHDDVKPSMCVSTGNDGKILIKCQAGCTVEDIVARMNLKMTDLFPEKTATNAPIIPKIVNVYDYTNADGKLLYQVCRYIPKNFKQRRPDPDHPGQYLWNMNGTQRVLYKLPKVLEAIKTGETVWIVEGEKAVYAAEAVGLVATNAPGGSCKWKDEYSKLFKDAVCNIIPDNDKPGHDHAVLVAKSLHGIAKLVCIIELPGLPPKGDIYDFVEARQDKDTKDIKQELLKIVAPPFVPPTHPTPSVLKPISDKKEIVILPGDEHLNYDIEFVKNEKGKLKPVTIPIPFNEVMERIMAKVQNRLARVDNLMFAKPDTPGGEIHYVENSAALFGRLGVYNKTTIDWTGTAKAMKKEEAFAEIHRILPCFRGIETAPHHPAMPNLYYNHPVLPEPDNDAVTALIDRFKPETPEDRAFILAMFLTALWGGGEGQRPAFVIASKDGRGSGKSTVGEMIACVLNQPFISGGTKQSIEDLKTRILSPQGLTSRVVIFDNETGRVSCGELAGLITSPLISGRRLYEGEGRRPNNLLWIITLNTPSLDSDLASRGIPVSISKPDYSPDWKTETLALIESKRWGIISALIAMLKTDTPQLNTCTRWGAWENEVLAKIGPFYPDMTKLQSMILERQRAFDDEADEVSLIHDGFVEAIKNADLDAELYPCFFKNSLASDIYNSVTGARVRKNTALRDIKNLIRTGAFPELSESQHGIYGRGFIWVTETAIGEDNNIQLVIRPEPSASYNS